MTKRLSLLGPPHSGKTTQAERLARTFGVPHIKASAMFRFAIHAGTPAGLRMKAYVERGELAPIDVAMAVVEERLREPDAARGFVFNDFPRTVEQAEHLDRLVALDRCIVFRIDDDVLVERSTTHRTDADELRLKLHRHREHMQPVLDHYAARGRLAEIDGVGTIDEVAARIEALL